jgi:hypothetical protein
MPPLEQVSTGFIAGVTVVLGIVALGVAEALVEPELGRGPAQLAGALAFAIGFVFLVGGAVLVAIMTVEGRCRPGRRRLSCAPRRSRASRGRRRSPAPSWPARC